MCSSVRKLLSAAVLAAAIPAAAIASDPVLKNEPSLFAGASGSTLSTGSQQQDAIVNSLNRATTLDGSLATATPGGVAPDPIVIKPKCDPIYWLSTVDLRTATVAYSAVDLALPTAGVPVGIGRVFNGGQGEPSKYHDSNGVQGYNWFQTALPEIVLSNNTIQLLNSNGARMEYQRVSSSDYFRGVNGAPGVFERTAANGTNYELYTLHEPTGRKMSFFGADSGSPNWQLWKITNPDGKRLYVGHPTESNHASTLAAYSSGNVSSFIQEQGDSADERKYLFSYATIAGKPRLTKVEVRSKSSGTFSVVVAQVDYEYYEEVTAIEANEDEKGDEQIDDDGLGLPGDLKAATTTIPLGNGSDEVRTSYYRYYINTVWSDTYDETKGDEHALKMVLEPEGYRRASAAMVVDSSGTGSLKSYSAAFFTYVDSGSDPRRVNQAFFNGECGCGGGVNGVTTFEWELNGSFVDTPVPSTTDPAYDAEWYSRTMVARADGTYQTSYFDEAGQSIATVVTPAAPPGSSTTNFWATLAGYDTNGRIASVYSPAAVDTYNHLTGALTPKTSQGLVTEYTRAPSGQTQGMVTAIAFKAAGGSATTLTQYTYTTRAVTLGSTVDVTRPLVSQVDQAVASGVWDTVNYAYDYWNGSGTSDYFAISSIKTTYPAVDATNNNGAGTAASAYSFLRKDGRPAFMQALDGIVSAILYNALGLPSKSIRDVDTAASPGYESVYEPGDFVYTGTGTALTSSGTELGYTTEMTYDPVGRLTLGKLPSGRYVGAYYSKLSDGRLVKLAFPEVTVSGGVPTHYTGPATYSVKNLAWRMELSATLGTGTVALSSKPTTDWINEGSSDPLDNLDTALRGSSREKVAGLATSSYDSAGSKLLETRAYTVISTSGTTGAWVGTSTDHDDTGYTYDNMGRACRVIDPTGTIARTVFDEMGRVTSRWVGTSDSSWPPVVGISASGDMTQVEALEYDGNAARGNGFLTKRTVYVAGDTYGFGSSTNKRETLYTYDVRGNLKLQQSPVSPHGVFDYDLRARITAAATYNAVTGLNEASSAATDANANSGATVRLTLSKTFYDERGQVFKTSRHNIDQTDGSDDDSLVALFWRDVAGRVIKEGGSLHVKRQHDRLGRVLREFQLARDNDSGYGDADDVAGDYVLTENQTLYDDVNKTGNVTMTANIARHHAADSSSVTGELDTGYGTPDEFDLQAGVSGAEVKGRIFITSFWYDSQDRQVGAVPYGTNGNADYDRAPSGSWASMPSRSSTVLLSETLYDDFGRMKLMKSPRVVGGNPLKTRYVYDAANRKVAEIRSDTGSDSAATTLSSPAAIRDTDVYTRYTFDRGQLKTMWVDTDGDKTVNSGDQVTTYTYGVVKSGGSVNSTIASNRLVLKVQYPNGASTTAADNTVTYTYNAQGQRLTKLDQNGTTHTFIYDTGGRILADAVAVGSGVDNAVLRIATAYNDRGMVSTVTQYDAASGGDETDQVAYKYDGWGNLTDYQQDNDDLVTGTSGANDYGVRYTYSKVNATGVGSTTRRTGIRRDYARLRYGGGTDAGYGSTVYGWQYTYENSSGGDTLLDGDAGWVTRVYKTNDDTLTALQLAEYRYGGDGRVLVDQLPVPTLVNRLYESGGGDPYGSYLDQWGRVIGSEWKTANGVVYRANPAYDESGNITSVSQYHTPYGAVYESDKLNRLVGAKVGTVSSGAISGTVFVEEDWTAGTSGVLSLTQTGNWANYVRSKDGTAELTADSTFRDNNQYGIRDVSPDGNPAADETSDHEATYDKNGNLVDDDKPAASPPTRSESSYGFRYAYDAWNRLRKVYDGNGQSGVLVEELRYNGLGHLIAEHADSDGDGDVDGSDLWRHNQYNERWQLLAVWEDADSLPSEVYGHHNAGRDGRGGASYIDELICRERDKDNARPGSGPMLSREERVYYVQNWRHDVVALVRSDSNFDTAVVERIRYDAYGRPTSFNPADVGRQGGLLGPDAWVSNDDVILALTTGTFQWYTDFGSTGGLGIPDGVLNANDGVAFNAMYLDGNGDYGGGGFGVLSGSNLDNRVGYAGYRFDPVLCEGGGADGKPVWHVRARWLDSVSGKWGQMDPLGYVDGSDLYEFTGSGPIEQVDPLGLCGQCVGQVQAPPDVSPGVKPSINPNNPPVWDDPLMKPDRPAPAEAPTRTPWWQIAVRCIPIPHLQACIRAWDGSFMIGSWLSPVCYPDIVMPTIEPTYIRIVWVSDLCEQAKSEKIEKCGEKNGTGYTQSFACTDDRMAFRYDYKNKSLMELYCNELLERIERGDACMAARRKLTELCFGGITDSIHAGQQDTVNQGRARCRCRFDIHCRIYRGEAVVIPSLNFSECIKEYKRMLQ